MAAKAVPGIGGAVAGVLNNWSAERKHERVRDVLNGLAIFVANLKSEVRQEYVLSEEFEELLDQTLRRAATERHEVSGASMRHSWRARLRPWRAISRTTSISQDDRELQRITCGLSEPCSRRRPREGERDGLAEPDPSQRLKDMPLHRIEDLAQQLTDERRLSTIARVSER